MFFDPLYLLLLLPAIALAAWAQYKVSSAYGKASQIESEIGLSGAETARRILDMNGLQHVPVELTEGYLSDHYDPSTKVVRLSPDVHDGSSLASLGIAAHEVGHAIQDATGYSPLVIRNFMVPAASFGSGVSWLLLVGGLVFHMFGLVLLGIAAYSLVVIFQLVNLPVEFDASARAKRILLESGMISADEHVVVKKVLFAAALTYVAATLTAIVTLIYFVIRSGLLNNGRR